MWVFLWLGPSLQAEPLIPLLSFLGESKQIVPMASEMGCLGHTQRTILIFSYSGKVVVKSLQNQKFFIIVIIAQYWLKTSHRVSRKEKKLSQTGNRTPAAAVRARNPNH